MCRRTTCKTCAKPTWAGCGRHVDQALAHVPPDERCPGHAREEQRGLLGRLFGGTA